MAVEGLARKHLLAALAMFMDYSVHKRHLEGCEVGVLMKLSQVFFACVAAATLFAGVPASAGGVERRVRDLVEAGEIVPFETIRQRVASQVRGNYMGVEFDEPTLTYRFRFLVDGEVINVDVDARTGQRRRQSRSY